MMSFGIGWSEVALIVLVGVLVIKPERLPETARYLGRLYRELSHGFYRVTQAIEKEVADLKKVSEPTRTLTEPLKKMAKEALAPLSPTELLKDANPPLDPPPAETLLKATTTEPDYPNYPVALDLIDPIDPSVNLTPLEANTSNLSSPIVHATLDPPPTDQPPRTQPPRTQPLRTKLPRTKPLRTKPLRTKPLRTKPPRTKPSLYPLKKRTKSALRP